MQAAKDAATDIDCGYPRNFSDKFRVDYVIGKVIAHADIDLAHAFALRATIRFELATS